MSTEAGVETVITLTCQHCGVTDESTSEDVTFNAERAIEDASWGYSDNKDMELICDECLMSESGA
jgi:hypothetical protein